MEAIATRLGPYVSILGLSSEPNVSGMRLSFEDFGVIVAFRSPNVTGIIQGLVYKTEMKVGKGHRDILGPRQIRHVPDGFGKVRLSPRHTRVMRLWVMAPDRPVDLPVLAVFDSLPAALRLSRVPGGSGMSPNTNLRKSS